MPPTRTDTAPAAPPEPGMGPSPQDAPILQLLSPAGERQPAPAPDLERYAAELTQERLRAAYRHMVITRALDSEATSLQRQGELGLWVPSRGQEAAQVGSAYAIPDTDMVFPSYREHAVALVRGLDERHLLPVFRGTRHGGWSPREHRFHLYTFVIAAHALHAVGYAMGLQQDRRRGLAQPAEAVALYFGDGATSEGDLNEAMVFAASAQAPVLFFLQNNHWAISVPAATQSRTPLAARAPGFGIPSLRVDGNDLLASYAATRRAMEHIRAGGGPYFIEAVTYRMGAHTTSDDPTRYRSRDEESEWAAKDPIVRLRRLLAAEDAAGPGEAASFSRFADGVEQEARELGARTREFVRANAAGPFAEVFDHVHASPHAQVERDRAAWLALQQREDAAGVTR